MVWFQGESMVEALQTKSIEQIFDEMIEAYTQGDYLEGCTPYGEDALMSPIFFFSQRFIFTQSSRRPVIAFTDDSM